MGVISCSASRCITARERRRALQVSGNAGADGARLGSIVVLYGTTQPDIAVQDIEPTLARDMMCRFCETEQHLIRAHIVPEGFFRVLRDGSTVPELHTNTPGAHPKRAPIGVYDKSILCGPCDNRFALWDKHAQDVLLRDFSDETAIHNGPEKIGWTIRARKTINERSIAGGPDGWCSSSHRETDGA